MIELLLTLVILLLVFGLLFWAIDLFPIDPKFRQLAKAVLAIIIVIYLLGMLFGEFPRFPLHNHG